ncbi:hypothetical protein HOLleu_10756 [Holothuria leucospilota]|uniref:Uncharacterized protein n=1 Tax=Holothuria leucospilota TaxID=206669 RepID=A0A9Q1CDZ5_HOLLE|nr:hypothetical protein HOLleu_10756 [Holothuria leucospilota]
MSVQTGTNKEQNDIASKLDIQDSISHMEEREAFITIKDHKNNFLTKYHADLSTLLRVKWGRVSKVILDRMIEILRAATKVNQWRNTSSMIDWFSSLKDKQSVPL